MHHHRLNEQQSNQNISSKPLNNNHQQRQYGQQQLQNQSITNNDNNNSNFICLSCKKQAHMPVVTYCGHMFCWKCIYKSSTKKRLSLLSDKETLCPYCKETCILDQCYPLYIDTQEHKGGNLENSGDNNNDSTGSKQNLEDMEIQPKLQELPPQQLSSQLTQQPTLPSRPTAKHRAKILNPNMIGAGLPLASNNLPSNTSLGKMIPGYVFMPSIGVQTFNSIDQGQQNDQDVIQSMQFKIKMHIMIILLILVVLWVLFY